MRPYTYWLGSWITPLTNPVSTMTLSKTLVNNPKYAFRSPVVHSRGAAPPPRMVSADVLIFALLHSVGCRGLPAGGRPLIMGGGGVPESLLTPFQGVQVSPCRTYR